MALPPDDLDCWLHAVLELIPPQGIRAIRAYLLRPFSPEQHAAQVITLNKRVTGQRSRDDASVP